MISADELYATAIVVLRGTLDGPQAQDDRERRARLRFIEVYARGIGESLDALLRGPAAPSAASPVPASTPAPDDVPVDGPSSDAGVVLPRPWSWPDPKSEADPPSVGDVTDELRELLDRE